MAVPTQILLIDDDAVDRANARRALSKSGLAHALVEAGDGDGGARLAEARTYDCVLLDYRLPGTDTFDLLAHLIAPEGGRQTVLMLTGEADPELPVLLMKAGAIDYLNKGEITPSGLARAIRFAKARRAFTSELEEANRELERQVGERTQALLFAREAADAARREAERASAAKTSFLAAMSHEIRTPLNAVIGFTDLLRESDRLPPDLRRYADLASTSGSALLTVVNDILDFSKVEANAIELAPRAFSVRDLVDNALSIVGGIAETKGLALDSAVDASVPRSLSGDEARLRQILLNLLNNAVKFTPSGRVTLQVRHLGSEGDGERLRISVSDTGIGIPPEKQHRLFERFSQIDDSATRDFGGTGLGLAICKRLVELMGGRIGIESDGRSGSTFSFELALPRIDPLPVSTAAARAEGTARRRIGHLLLVEDVAINQELARLVIEKAGHTVEIAGDGASAVKAVEAGAFDLVLMDVQMPGMDGMTATRLIRALDGPKAQVPVIAMTANVLPDQVRQFREAGMDDHVGKPFDRRALYAAIDRWLNPATVTLGSDIGA